jgi:hypothetical protein
MELRFRDLIAMISSFKSFRSGRGPPGRLDLDLIHRGSLTMVTPPWKYIINKSEVLTFNPEPLSDTAWPAHSRQREGNFTSNLGCRSCSTVPQNFEHNNRIPKLIRKEIEGLTVILDHFSIQKARERCKSRKQISHLDHCIRVTG